MRIVLPRQACAPCRVRRRGRLTTSRPAKAGALALVLAAAAVLTGALPPAHVAAARADEVTASQDNLRTGWDSGEAGLGPASDGGPVGGPGFGQLFETHLNGQIYAQPVVAGQTVIVATETNHVYGLDAVTGAVRWSDYLGPAEPSRAVNCHDLTPDVGITSTPVYDPAAGNVYLVAIVNSGPITAQPRADAFALDAQTGAIRTGWPVAIQGSPVNDPGIAFDPLTERQRPGLLLLNGSVYAAFGSYCDYLPYAGYVAGVSTTTRHLTLWTDEAGVTDNQGGIWQGGGGLMSDGSGRIFLATGNGVSPAPGGGASAPSELGDSVVRLDVGASGVLSAADFFSPANAPALDAADLDFGSGGPVGLPFGTAALPHLLVQAGKDGRVFLLDRDDLGGREQGAGGSDDIISQTGPFGGEWGHPAAFGPQPAVSGATSSDYVYYAGDNDQLRYLQFGLNGSTPELTDVAGSSTTFGYTSGSPVVTSNGGDPATAVVWEVYASGVDGTAASLQAFPAVPSGTCTATAQCTISPIWSAPLGTVTNFAVPATDDGRVYVGTRDGNLFGFGSPDTAPLSSEPVNFGQVTAGKARTITVTVTAASQVTVRGIALSGPFKAGSVQIDGAAVRFPVTLAAAGALQVPVTFTPGRAGGVTGALQVSTDSANFPSVSVSLTGQGTAPGLYASTAAVAFGRIADKITAAKTVLIVNGGTGPARVTAVTRPGSPFSARLPAIGKILSAGQSMAVPVSYRPARVGSSTSAFTITTSGRHKLSLRLTGTGKAAVSKLTAGTASVSFGRVAAGSRDSRTIVISNAGDLPATVTAVTGVGVPFGSQVYVPAGLPINPRYTVAVPVTFTPASPGLVTGRLVLHWRDVAGRHAVAVQLSGTGVAAAPSHAAVPPPGGGWTLNGSAAMSGQQVVLTRARYEAGSAVYAVPQASNGLQVSFDAQLTGGGMTMSLLDAATAGPSALGRNGGNLGLGGQRGVAVTLAAAQHGGGRSDGFAGIATSGSAGLHYVASTTKVPQLGTGTSAVTVTVAGHRVSVRIDGRQVLTTLLGSAAVPAKALIAFTGGTGGAAGSQILVSAAIRAAGRSLPPPGGGWSFNAAAQMAAGAVRLTAAKPNAAGSVVYPAAVRTNGLKATFTAQLAGGSGGDGLTFALLNPADSTATSVGSTGKAQGFGGLAGVAVALDTIRADSDGSTNSVYLCQSSAGSSDLTITQTAQAIPPLRAGVDTVTVEVTQEQGSPLVTVWLDGEQVLREIVPGLTPTAMLAFTGATDAKTDVHLVRDVAISTIR